MLSAKKVLYATFFSGEGIAIQMPMKKGKSVTGKYYKDVVLKKLKKYYQELHPVTGLKHVWLSCADICKTFKHQNKTCSIQMLKESLLAVLVLKWSEKYCYISISIFIYPSVLSGIHFGWSIIETVIRIVKSMVNFKVRFSYAWLSTLFYISGEGSRQLA